MCCSLTTLTLSTSKSQTAKGANNNRTTKKQVMEASQNDLTKHCNIVLEFALVSGGTV